MIDLLVLNEQSVKNYDFKEFVLMLQANLHLTL